jgi:hypothetical protein
LFSQSNLAVCRSFSAGKGNETEEPRPFRSKPHHITINTGHNGITSIAWDMHARVTSDCSPYIIIVDVFYYSIRRPDRFWGPPSLLSNG